MRWDYLGGQKGGEGGDEVFSGRGGMRDMAVFRVLIAALVIVGMAQSAQAGDWPMFRHDPAHSGESNEIVNPPLELKWKFQSGGGIYSSPAISSGIVYVGSTDNYIYAIDSNNGKLKWKYKTGKKISSSPAISNGIVYVGSDDKHLYALDTITGNLKWKYQTSGEIRSSPTVNEKKVYVGTYDGMIYALNAENSELKWKFQASRHIISSPAISNGVLYIGSIDGYNGYTLVIG